MTDRDIITDHGRVAFGASGVAVRDMHDGTVLDVAARTDANAVYVAAQHTHRPDRGVRPDLDIADYCRRFVYVC
jgi:hypothetical protein